MKLSVKEDGLQVEQIAGELAEYGADKILVGDDPALADYTTDVYTNVSFDIVKNNDPKIVLLGASAQGKDLSARLAARLNAGLVMDCTSLKLEDQTLIAIRPVFGGKVLAEVAIEDTPQIAAIRPNEKG